MQHDGYSEAEALQRIDYSLGLHAFKGGKSASTVEQYLGLVLARRSPGYLAHGPHLLKAALDIAAARIARGLPSGGYGYPPHAWLASGMTVEEFNQEFGKRLGSSQSPLIPGSQFDAAFAEFMVRWQKGDELWRFSSPAETWRMMMGRGGIALVRDGRSIAHIETIMN